MHACGHDGHMTMLLVQPKLSENPSFDGTVVFIFQPNEELGLAKRLMRAFCKNSSDEIYAIHNLPGAPVGQISTKSQYVQAKACLKSHYRTGRPCLHASNGP